MLIHVLCTLSIVIYRLSSAEPKIPVTTCKRDLVDYSACLKRNFKEAWPRFIAGLPEFDFPSLDPFFFDYGKFDLNGDEIHGYLIIANVNALGLSKTRFIDVRAHFLNGTFRLEIDTILPNLFLNGSAEMNGVINVFRVLTKVLLIYPLKISQEHGISQDL